MIRRGFLRGMGGLMAIMPSVNPARAIANGNATIRPSGGPMNLPSGDDDGVSLSASDGLSSEERRKRWKLFQSMTEGTKRRQRRTTRMLALTGGWPPGIACMESNALWFRAYAAERWIERRVQEDKSIMDSIHEQLYGEKYYD